MEFGEADEAALRALHAAGRPALRGAWPRSSTTGSLGTPRRAPGAPGRREPGRPSQGDAGGLDGSASGRPLGRGLLAEPLPDRPGARPHRAPAALHVRRHERGPQRSWAGSPTRPSTPTPAPRPGPRARSARSSTWSWPSCSTPTARTCWPSRPGPSGSPPSASWSAPSATSCATRWASSTARSTSCARGPATTRGCVKHVDRIAEQVVVANGIITNLLDMIREPAAGARAGGAGAGGGAGGRPRCAGRRRSRWRWRGWRSCRRSRAIRSSSARSSPT